MLFRGAGPRPSDLVEQPQLRERGCSDCRLCPLRPSEQVRLSLAAEGTGGAPPVSLTRPGSEPSKPESSEDGAVAVTFTEAGSLGITFGSRKDAPGGVAVIPPYIKALKPGGMAEACEF